MLKNLLIFLIGALAGANVLYFFAVRDRPANGGRVVTVTPTPPVSSTGSQDATRVFASTQASTPATTPLPPQPTPQPAAPATPAGLIVPVSGIAASQLADTFADARGADRVHDAIDIMAPAGTPVLAAADGSVEKLFDSKLGGVTLYQFEPTGRYVYYYAHMQGYAPGIVENKTLRQGEVIGYVGSTGNASADAPHLHFAISLLGPEQQWWKATAINPYPLLRPR